MAARTQRKSISGQDQPPNPNFTFDNNVEGMHLPCRERHMQPVSAGISSRELASCNHTRRRSYSGVHQRKQGALEPRVSQRMPGFSVLQVDSLYAITHGSQRSACLTYNSRPFNSRLSSFYDANASVPQWLRMHDACTPACKCHCRNGC